MEKGRQLDETKETPPAGPRAKRRRVFKPCYLLGMAGIIGSLLFVIIMLTLDAIQPGDNPIVKTISELVYGSYGWLQTLAFIAFGILFLAFVVRLYSMTRRKIGSITGASFFSVTGISFFLVAAYPAQTGGLEMTFQGLMHNSFAGLISASFIIGCIAFAFHFRRDPHWRGYWPYTILTVVLCLAFALLWAVIPPEWQLRGLSERLLLISGFAWVSFVSLKMVRACARSRA